MAKGDWQAACTFEGKAEISMGVEVSTRRPTDSDFCGPGGMTYGKSSDL